MATSLAAHGRVLGSSAISDGGGHEETGAVSRRQGGTHLGLEEGGLEESGGMETDGTAARDGAQAEEKEKERVGEAAASSRLERAQPISRGRSRTSTPIEESVVEGGGETEGGAQCQPVERLMAMDAAADGRMRRPAREQIGSRRLGLRRRRDEARGERL